MCYSITVLPEVSSILLVGFQSICSLSWIPCFSISAATRQQRPFFAVGGNNWPRPLTAGARTDRVWVMRRERAENFPPTPPKVLGRVSPSLPGIADNLSFRPSALPGMRCINPRIRVAFSLHPGACSLLYLHEGNFWLTTENSTCLPTRPES